MPTLNGVLIPGISSSIGVDVSGSVAGQVFSGSYAQFDGISVNGLTGVHTESKSITTSGILSPGPSLPVNPTSPTFALPVGTPIQLTLTLSVSAGWDASVAGTAGGVNAPDFMIDSLADFSHTLNFAQSGPVFSLPVGYTVDSVSANVVNNVALPEPSSVMSTIGGFLFLLALRAHRTAN